MSLCLPSEKIATFINHGDSIYNYRAEELFTRRIEVKPEQATVTRTTTTTRSSQKSSRSKSKASKSKKSKKSRSSSVTIKNGDTLIDIAKRNGTTVEKLRKLNRIKGSNIRAGKKIRVK